MPAKHDNHTCMAKTNPDSVLLLYGGNETSPLTRRVPALPWWQVC